MEIRCNLKNAIYKKGAKRNRFSRFPLIICIFSFTEQQGEQSTENCSNLQFPDIQQNRSNNLPYHLYRGFQTIRAESLIHNPNLDSHADQIINHKYQNQRKQSKSGAMPSSISGTS